MNIIFQNCAFYYQCKSNLYQLKLFKITYNENKKFTPKLFNLIVCKILDIILGVCFLLLCFKFQCFVISAMYNSSKDLLDLLRNLLIYLMGSPIGLKLNYTLNNSLGKFYFYHINLWRVFLHILYPLMEKYFNLLLLPAFLGISFEISLICDILSLATFHVYCIYVYAARLFSFQVNCLISLSRLFIGRKWNPLRNRVDSCEYSSNQLFIGTLGFTILLFLLPTTTMYYVVFAAFRLLIVVFYRLLYKLKEILENLPLYVIVLWIINSQSVPQAPKIELQKIDDEDHFKVITKYVRIPLKEYYGQFRENLHENSECVHLNAKLIFHLFTGKLI